MATPTNLGGFLSERREEIVERWLRRAGEAHGAAKLEPADLRGHVPEFVVELSGEAGDAAARHGARRCALGLGPDALVREFALLGDTLLQTLDEAGATPPGPELRALLARVHEGAASAVAAWQRGRTDEVLQHTEDRLGIVAHDLRSPLATAASAMMMLRKLQLTSGGELVEIMQRSLNRLRDTIDTLLTVESFVPASMRPPSAEERDAGASTPGSTGGGGRA